MKLNPIHSLFGSHRQKPPVLLAVTPPRTGESTLLGVENLLGSIAVPEPFSLEIAGDADGVTLMARCHDKQVIQGQIAAHYPQARIREVPEEEDPLRLEEGEQAWGMTLLSSGPEYAPLRTFRDDTTSSTPAQIPSSHSWGRCPICGRGSESSPASSCAPSAPTGPSPTSKRR